MTRATDIVMQSPIFIWWGGAVPSAAEQEAVVKGDETLRILLRRYTRADFDDDALVQRLPERIRPFVVALIEQPPLQRQRTATAKLARLFAAMRAHGIAVDEPASSDHADVRVAASRACDAFAAHNAPRSAVHKFLEQRANALLVEIA